jgi:LysR family glycine cleavage system transcriptional activator
LEQFRARHSTTEVRVSTALSSDPELKGRFDVAIRPSPGDQSRFEVTPLFTESATVIASAKLLKERAPKRPSDLVSAVLLSTESRPGDWHDWFKAAGCADLRPSC